MSHDLAGPIEGGCRLLRGWADGCNGRGAGALRLRGLTGFHKQRSRTSNIGGSGRRRDTNSETNFRESHMSSVSRHDSGKHINSQWPGWY